MKCPGCATEMAVKRVITVEIDYCPSCKGIALDKGETEVIAALGVARIIEGSLHQLAPDVSTFEIKLDKLKRRTTKAHCHACQRDMIALTGAGEVEYDWCDGCERLFFDAGELSAIESFKAD